MPYTALMLDICKSRQYDRESRQKLQDFCLKATDLLNGIYEKSLVKPVEFSAGDEMQGLAVIKSEQFLALADAVRKMENNS